MHPPSSVQISRSHDILLILNVAVLANTDAPLSVRPPVDRCREGPSSFESGPDDATAAPSKAGDDIDKPDIPITAL